LVEAGRLWTVEEWLVNEEKSQSAQETKPTDIAQLGEAEVRGVTRLPFEFQRLAMAALALLSAIPLVTEQVGSSLSVVDC
jgi:hypothetical protein